MDVIDMIGLLVVGLILWRYSSFVAEFFECVKDNVLCPIGEWFCNMLEPAQPTDEEPFVVSEYLARVEKAHLDILENQEAIDKIIVLWWGMDGLRLNEDGTLKWVSRKKKPTETVFYQPQQSIQPIQTGMFLMDQTQSTRAQMEAMMAQNAALQMQSWQNMQIANVLQQCCVQYPAQYPSYYYGGCCGNYIG